jgi:molybdopterin-guanine dinucleotide biosynthesis protein A
MGRDKASLVLDTVAPATVGTETLGARTARLLRAGPPRPMVGGGAPTDLPRVADLHPLSGPLAALADAAGALRARGWSGPVLVVATDLPRLSGGMLAWLAGHPTPRALVPLDPDGRAQPLCARYPWAAMELAEDLVAGGATRMGVLMERAGPLLCPSSEWAGPAGGTDVLTDVDTPGDVTDLNCAGRSDVDRSDVGRSAVGRPGGRRDG